MHIDTFLHNARYLLENNMAFFSKKADSGRKTRSKVLERYFEGITRNKDGQAVLEWRVPSSSHPGKSYTCYISVEPKHASLFVLASAGGRVGDKMQLIKDADVRCFCTCPDFNWSGMKYNMKHRYGGYEEGHTSEEGIPDGSDIRPRVRDPRGKNTVCKHLLASFNGIMLNAPTIMKAARTAKFPKEYTQDEEAPQVLGRDAENRASGQINQMNGRGNESPASGEIGMANSGTSRKPVVDYPEGKDPITMLGESAPVKIPEAQEALDALANTLGDSGDSRETPGDTGEIGTFNSGDESGEESGSDITMFNDGQQEFNPLTDIEDAAQLPMFNPGPSEEDDEKNKD